MYTLNWTMKPVPVTWPLKSAKLHQHENTGIIGRSIAPTLTSGCLGAVIGGQMNVTESAKLTF
jgi:hypothetical protein